MNRELIDPVEAGVHPGRLKAVLDRARLDVEDGPLPSCQIAIARSGRLVAFETYGDARPDQRYVLQSAGRPYVAAVVWKLLSDGLVALDERVGDMIPEFATNGKEVATFGQVVSHTGGFPMAPCGYPKMKDRELRLQAMSRWRLDYEPGTKLMYHLTSAAWVIAEVCERRSGLPIWDFLEQRIAAPLGLTVSLHVPPAVRHATVAPMVAFDAPPGVEPTVDPWGPWYLYDDDILEAGEPSHSMVSTAADLALLYQAFHHSGVWTPEAVAAGSAAYVELPMEGNYGIAGKLTRMGLFLEVGDRASTASPAAYGTSGASCQFSWYDPATEVSVAFVTNGYPLAGYDHTRAGRARMAVIGALAGDITAD
ncbi:MAG: serine hydrolase domain-containing protein [Acidimicrobiia bacterium]